MGNPGFQATGSWARQVYAIIVMWAAMGDPGLLAAGLGKSTEVGGVELVKLVVEVSKLKEEAKRLQEENKELHKQVTADEHTKAHMQTKIDNEAKHVENAETAVAKAHDKITELEDAYKRERSNTTKVRGTTNFSNDFYKF